MVATHQREYRPGLRQPADIRMSAIGWRRAAHDTLARGDRGPGRGLSLIPATGRLSTDVERAIGRHAQDYQIDTEGICLGDDSDRQPPRGVYFVRLETTNYSEARKLILTE